MTARYPAAGLENRTETVTALTRSWDFISVMPEPADGVLWTAATDEQCAAHDRTPLTHPERPSPR